jgi:hypothetical protein
LKHSPWAHCIDNYPVKVPDTVQFDDWTSIINRHKI